MSKPKKYSLLAAFLPATCLLAACLLGTGTVAAQYYSWGGDPASVRWRRLETSAVKLVYPADFESNARRAMWYLDTVRSHIDFGFRHGTMHTPVVLHTRNMVGNGMVMWAPKRIELLAAPGSSYSEPWLKQLAIHEYRHNVQYNNLRRGVNRVLGWFLGEQIAFLGVGQFSIFILEGDATMAETEMSAFGRGLQPSFTMHYRAVGDVGQRRRADGRKYANDYWFSGSFRDFVPDHYHLGYQMARWSYNNFDKFIWDDIARYVSRNPQFIVPMSVGLKKQYGLSQTSLFRRTFADLNAYWHSLPEAEDSSAVRIATPETSYTTYRWPLWLDENTLVAFKSDFDRYNRIVRIDVRTGDEQTLTYTGSVSSRPALSPDGRLLWTEYRSSTFWDEKVNSRLCSYDLATGRRQTHPDGEQMFFPTPTADGEIAYVAYDYSGRYSIVNGNDRLGFPLNIEITGLAWDDDTGNLYFIGLDDGGMFLGSVTYDDGEGYQRLTPSRHISISDLRAGDGKLWFGSIASGKDEAHCYDLATGIEYRLSESAYGSFQPSPAPSPAPSSSDTDPNAMPGGNPDKILNTGKIALTTYDRHGYHLAVQNTREAARQPLRTLPVDLVNPPWKRWNLPKMDSLVYTAPDAAESAALHKPRKYRKALNLFRPHSWLPLDFYPPAAIQEGDLSMNLGATVMSQNLLSNTVSWLRYGWSANGGNNNDKWRSMLRGGFSYSGLGPVFDVDFTLGGTSQVLYTPLPANLELERKPYFSATVRASLPMTLGSGYLYSSLTPSAEYFYTNGLLFRHDADRLGGTLTRGVERLSFALNYSTQTRMAQKEFLPRWGFGARVGYVMNPTNRDFGSMVSASLRSWLPGVVRPHSTSLKLAWQQTVSRNDAPLSFQMKELFPRGARYDFSTRRWASGSLDYQLPVWYPEGGIPGFIYFKRIRINVFADYARWQDFAGGWHPLFSYGGDVILDISPLRMPASTAVSVRLTIAKPSDRNRPWVNFGFELPL